MVIALSSLYYLCYFIVNKLITFSTQSQYLELLKSLASPLMLLRTLLTVYFRLEISFCVVNSSFLPLTKFLPIVNEEISYKMSFHFDLFNSITKYITINIVTSFIPFRK